MDNLAELREAARAVSEHAYAPYSGCRVGAAVLGASGRIFAGCNVENVSFGLTVCAERNAVSQAVAAGERELHALALYTPTDVPTPPCGACRQVLQEFGPEALVIAGCASGEERQFRLGELFPRPFARLPGS